jgi:glycosyltransferase involved in cell wall biosynthesis
LATRILLTGPIFNTPAGPSGMGGMLYNKLKQEGHHVAKKSAFRNIFLRYIDTVLAVVFFNYNVLFIQGFALRAFYLESVICRIAKLRGKKIVYNIHGGAFPEFYTNNANWCQKVFSQIDCIVTPSQYIKAFLEEKGHTIEYIPNFINSNDFPYNWQYSGKHNLLWVRSFHDIYKPELAIKTIHSLKQKFPDIHLTMIGPDQGKLAESLVLIHSLQLNDDITITGPVSNKDLTGYYCCHSVFITTTSYESFGVSLVEAASSGIPMVSTSVGEIPYLWQTNENCLLVEDNDVNAFAEAVERILTNKDLQLKISAAARKKAEQYTWDNIKHKWDNLLQ